MATVTRKGRELAGRLAGEIGYTAKIDETCSRICRSAQALHTLNVAACNGDVWLRYSGEEAQREDAKMEARREALAAHLDHLVGLLPETTLGPFTVKPEQDPRGCTVILAPEGSRLPFDSWGHRNGICVPRND
jgi:hypothetical protein